MRIKFTIARSTGLKNQLQLLLTRRIKLTELCLPLSASKIVSIVLNRMQPTFITYH